MRKTIVATTLATVAVLGGTATAASAETLAGSQVVAQTETTTEDGGGDGDKSGLLGLLGLAGLAGLLRRRENADAHKH